MKQRKSSGFTLIELVAVMAILVVLAGLIIPRIDSLQTKANKSAAASNMHATARSIMLFKAMHNSYPNPWDSMLDASGTNLFKAPDAQGPGLEPQLTGGYGTTVGSGFPKKLKVIPITQIMADSMSRTGITTVLDRNAASTGIPGDQYKGGASRDVGGLGNIAAIDETDGDGEGIWRQAFPGKTDAEIGLGGSPAPGSLIAKGDLIALGVGPSNEMIGDAILNVPSYANIDPAKFYNRLIAIFYVRKDTAKRAFLRGVLGADGDNMQDEIADFYEVDE
jgi:prepilin-type N-terminal cleavage/methylation domain-containing protein